MIFIDTSRTNIAFALEEHYKNTRCLIWKKINAKDHTGLAKVCSDPACKICKGRIECIADIPQPVYDFFNNDGNVEQLLRSFPGDLFRVDERFWNIIFPGQPHLGWLGMIKKEDNVLTNQEVVYKNEVKAIIHLLKKIIAYDDWFVASEPTSQYSAYHLATYLDFRSCVYCNRTYTITAFYQPDNKKGIKKLIRPQFDHWMTQEKFPLLALSFYNLIPSCSICNSAVKNRTSFRLEDHIHPYLDNILDSVTFSYRHYETIDQVKVEVIGVNNDKILESRINHTLQEFRLEEMYNAHGPELLDMLKLKTAYSKDYLEDLKKSFPQAGLTDDEIYRLAFGVELNASDFNKRPFSKFKYDILKELGVIGAI